MGKRAMACRAVVLALALCVASAAASPLAPSSSSFLEVGQKRFFGNIVDKVKDILGHGPPKKAATPTPPVRVPEKTADCNDWACVYREMTALQNKHEMEVTRLNQDFQMKYMKLQEKLSNNMSPMMLPPMMAGMGAGGAGGAPMGSMFGGIPPLPPIPPASPVYGGAGSAGAASGGASGAVGSGSK